MKYYIDCEFNGLGGRLLSMGIVREDGYSFYATHPVREQCDPWVAENVVPILFDVPAQNISVIAYRVPYMRPYLEKFFKGDNALHIISDDEQDIMYLCQQLKASETYTPSVLPDLTFEVKRVDVYPTPITQAVQHNAFWDAVVLWNYFVNDDLITRRLAGLGQ